MKPLAVRATLVVLFASFTSAQTMAQDTTSLPGWSREPTSTAPDSDKQLPPSAIQMRQKRADAFRDSRLKPLDAPPGTDGAGNVIHFGHGYAADPKKLPALPVQQSGAIVIGTLSGHDAYFSSDHARVVSELTIQVENVLKDSSKSLTAGTNAVLLEPGGALRLKSGDVIRDPVSIKLHGIELGGRYVFFLNPDQSLGAFTLVKAWGIAASGHMVPCNVYDIIDAAKGDSTAPEDEPSFVNSIISAIPN